MSVQDGIKEWAGVVDALGSGQQSVLIRTYPAPFKRFLLYPTFTYYAKNRQEPEVFAQQFKPDFIELSTKSGEIAMKRARDECLVDIRFLAELIDEVSISDSNIWPKLSDMFIWSTKHVESYAANSKGGAAYLWLVRIYELPTAVTVGRISQGGPPSKYRFANPVSTKGAKPVLSEDAFESVRRRVKEKIQGSSLSGQSKRQTN